MERIPTIDQEVIDDDLMEPSLELEHWTHIAGDDGLDNFNLQQEEI